MAERRIQFERQMSEPEALMWALEQDPVLRSTFANVTFFDRPVDLDRFRARMARAARLIPRLRQRVIEPVGGMGPPTWDDDQLFDLDFHVRRIAVPPPGSDRQVLDLAALLSSDPFDRARPLWQSVLVEGLEGGRGALVQKMHHTITDGEGGVRLSAMFVDLERDPLAPLAGADAELEAAEADHGDEPPSGPTPVDRVRNGLRLPLDLARRALADTVENLANPTQVPARASEALEASRSVLRQLSTSEPSHSPLWAERSLRRHLEVLSVGLDDTIRAAKGLGGSVNDLFVTGAVGAAGAYHRRKGAPVDQLRMAMPVSTRTDKGSGRNSFAPTRMLVPAGIADPVERFAAVRAVIAAARSERSVGLTSRLAGLLSVLPNPVLVRVARQQVGTVDFTTSNVRGAPFDLFIGGARITDNYPIGPMAGTAFNLTTLSQAGRLDMGCVVDPAAVDDPGLLRTCLIESYDELLGVNRKRPRRPAKKMTPKKTQAKRMTAKQR